jgi:hypothetical protein
MRDTINEIIRLILASTMQKKQIVTKYAGSDETVCKIMVNEARAGIRQNADELNTMLFLLKRFELIPVI